VAALGYSQINRCHKNPCPETLVGAEIDHWKDAFFFGSFIRNLISMKYLLFASISLLSVCAGCSKDASPADFDYERIVGTYSGTIFRPNNPPQYLPITIVKDGSVYFLTSDYELPFAIENLKFEINPCHTEENPGYYCYQWANLTLELDEDYFQPEASVYKNPVDVSNFIKYWDHFRGDGASFTILFKHKDGQYYYRLEGDREY
jgi:hypothetical protein